MKTKTLAKFTVLLVVALFSGLNLQGCKQIKEVPQASLEGYWVLNTLNGKQVSDIFAGAFPTLELNFRDSLVSGTGGCNHYSGKFTYEKGLFNAPDLALTRMLCSEDNAEPEFIIALTNKNNEFVLVNDTLTVMYEGKSTLKFLKTDIPKPVAMNMEPDSINLSGKWMLKIIDGSDAKTKFANEVPSIEFDFLDNRVFGFDGCNRYNADFSLNKFEMVLGPIMSTRMACDNMLEVAQFTQAISDTSMLTIPNQNILQLAKNGIVLLEFEKIADTDDKTETK